jgi:branched-chain amino acid transport system ATP-binding protein
MLKLSGLSVSYGGLHALSDVSLDVADGEFVTIVGPNGAGKTTLLKAIAGAVPPAAGRIEYGGTDVARWPAHVRARRGIAHVPEGRKVFASMTVLENLEMGSFRAVAKPQRAETIEVVYALFPVLRERCTQLAGSLSGGEQQMCAIGRALMARPKLLMLDEPTLGLAPVLVGRIFETVRTINADGVTVLIVEQNVRQALGLADRAAVLESGKLVLEGAGRELLGDERLKRAYLGM